MVEWDFQDDYGVKRTIQIKANYKFRLLSPQPYFLEHKSGSYHLDHTGSVFTFKGGGSLRFNYTRGSILPFARRTTPSQYPKELIGE